MFHSQLGDLIDLARAFPETRIVLNHVGGPLAVGPYTDKRKEVFESGARRFPSSANFPTSTSSSAGSAIAKRL
jgi:L-fuconolactonase